MKKSFETLFILYLTTLLLTLLIVDIALANESPATRMHKKEDVFLGSFSPSEVTAVPNKPFDVSFTISPTMDASDTTVQFILPADMVTLVKGDAAWHGDLKKGEKLTLSLSLTTQGEIEADVKAKVETSSEDKAYQNSYYLHVAVPMTEEATHRVIKVKSEGQPATSNPVMGRIEMTSTPKSPAGPGAGQIEVKGSWWYVNDEGGWSPGRYMLAELWDAKTSSFVASQWTGGDGNFDFIVSNVAGGRNPYVRFYAEGAWDWITTTSGGDRYNWATGVLGTNVPDLWVYDTGSIAPGSNGNSLMAGDAVFTEMNWVYWNSGISWERPTKVTVRWPRESWPHSHGDYIDLPTSGWDHVTVYHESGHCVLWTCYGGSWPEGSAFCSHYVSMEDPHIADAWDEGWAEFMEAVVDNDPNNLQSGGHNIETNDWYNHDDAGDMDGAYVEGEVASILWDIWDPVNVAGDDDHMAWGYDEIFTVLRLGDTGADDNPNSILEFWDDWETRWPTNSTSMGPLCDIYYNYGIDEDWYNPFGSISINSGNTYTTSRTVTLTISGDDWGVGVQYMRFSEDYGATWSGWYTYGTSMSYTLKAGADGYRRVDVQFADLWWLSNSGAIYDGIWLDTVAPTGTIVINSGANWTNSRTVSLGLTSSDATSGVAKVRFSENMGAWTQWYTYTSTFSCVLNTTGDGYKTVDVQFQDNAGLNSTAWARWDGIYLDTTDPSASIIIGSGNPLYTTSTSVTLYLTYSDALSGVYQVRYGNGGSTWGAWEAPNATKAWTLLSGDGSKSVWFEVKDNAGNVCNQVGDFITLDTTAPNGSIVVGSGNPTYANSQSVTLYLSYFDAASGVYQVRYGNSGGWSAWEAPAATKAWNLTAGDGTKTVWYQVVDNVGFTSPMYSDSIILDATPPNGSIIIGSGNATYTTTTSVTLYLTYSDALSGVYQVRYGNSGGTWTAWEAPSATKAWTLSSGDGGKGVYYQVMDNASSISQFYDSIILDTAAPTGSIVINSGNPPTTSTTAVTLYLTYSDTTSGVNQVRYSNDGTWDTELWEAPAATKAWTLTPGDGVKTVFYQIRDYAGLLSATYADNITLASVSLATWAWGNNTVVNCVAAADVDADGQTEIVTGGYYNDGTRNVSQLVVWTGSGLAVDRLTTWYWTGDTVINSVAIGDVDDDGQVEIVTGGYHFDGTRQVAQLVVWTGSSLAVDRLTTWYWTGNTVINSVAVGDVDGDAQVEIVTGGYHNDGTRNRAQLVIWTGSSLAVDRLTTWYWTGNTVINSVAVGDVDADAQVEIVTGGYHNDGTRNVAQLVVWTGSGLAVDRLTTWYWTGNTQINSVAVGDVDADAQVEIVSGGYFNDGTRDVAQLVVWTGSTLAVDRLTTWYWTGNTVINSVGLGDADGDGQEEIVTGGCFDDGTRNVAQMVSWSGSSLAVENIQTWYWVGDTVINSVCVSDVNGDAAKEIVTGGAYDDGVRWNAQLAVWP